MNQYEMNMELILEAVSDTLLSGDNDFNYYSEETTYRIKSLEQRIDNSVGLDEEFKTQFLNDFCFAFEGAAIEAFESGLKIGLSMLKNLLTATVPEIRVIKEEPQKVFHDAPTVAGTDRLEAFRKYMNDAAEKLSDDEKGQIQSKTEYLIEKHRKQTNDLL